MNGLWISIRTATLVPRVISLGSRLEDAEIDRQKRERSKGGISISTWSFDPPRGVEDDDVGTLIATV